MSNYFLQIEKKNMYSIYEMKTMLSDKPVDRQDLALYMRLVFAYISATDESQAVILLNDLKRLEAKYT